ncbi:hypothetical protein ABZV78_14645 [Micromonospora sp. NPDC004540]|uniref:hypothetical protein n=1 Tax=Micromonospora sp. NPDC004540 TaxID=3154457 RepID=UPI0033BF8808
MAGLLSAALLEIRMLAFRPDLSRHPDGHLAEIHLIADVCHNLPRAAAVRAANGFDPFVYMWQTATADQQRWLSGHLKSLGVDHRYLVQNPSWPPPVTTPAQRPRLARRGWRIPRNPGGFVAVDTAKLGELVREAHALEPSGRKSPEWTIAHLRPEGQHILRPSRLGEPLFLPDGPGDLRQYRGLIQMRDGATVVDHLRIRESSFASLPAKLSPIDRWLLAAAPYGSRERDVYLWGRDHRSAEPDCSQCLALALASASASAGTPRSRPEL